MILSYQVSCHFLQLNYETFYQQIMCIKIVIKCIHVFLCLYVNEAGGPKVVDDTPVTNPADQMKTKCIDGSHFYRNNDGFSQGSVPQICHD